jgi:hypothetical protein
VLGQRPGQPRDADHARVGRDEQDRRGQQADVVFGPREHRAVQTEVRDHAQDRVVFEVVPERGGVARLAERLFELGAVADAVVHHGQCRQRHHGDAGVHGENGDDHEVDRLGDLRAGVPGLLGHVGDRLDAGVGEHRQRQREDQLAPAGRDAEVHLVDQQRGVEHQEHAHGHQQHLRAQIHDREDEVELGGLPQSADVQHRQRGHHDQAADDVVRVVLEGVQPREGTQVMRYEERRDGDREDVVQAQRPAGEERDHVVERMARERGGAARFGEHRSALGVRFCGQGEQAAGEQEHQRREAERVRGHQAERVVDRGAHVAVGRGEHPRDAD